MDFGNVLESMENSSFTNQTNLKINFLQKEKQRLESLVSQLASNNDVLRHVTHSFGNEENDAIVQLTKANKQLEKEKIQIFQKQEKIIAESFLTEQIMEENQSQMRQITKNYEDKILELRRSVQAKETAIQDFQNRLKPNESYDEILVPPYNVSMHFYAQFDEYKETINVFVKKNNQLKKENQKLNQRLKDLQKKTEKLESSIKSRHSFLQLKEQLHEQKSHSLSPRKSQIPQPQKISLKKVEESMKNNWVERTTGDSLSFESSFQINTLKQLLKKKHIEAEGIKKRNRLLTQKYAQKSKLVKTLTESNKFYIERRECMIKELNYYKDISKTLTQTFMRRKQFPRSVSEGAFDHLRNKQIEKLKKEDNFKKDKTYWADISKQLNQKLKQFPIKVSDQSRKRSLSCMGDFLNLTRQEVKNMQQGNELMEEEGKKANESNYFENDISIIGGSKLNEAKKAKKIPKKILEEKQEIFENIFDD